MKRIELSEHAYRSVIRRMWVLCVLMALLALVLSLVGTPIPLLLADIFSLCVLLLLLSVLSPAKPIKGDVRPMPGHAAPTVKTERVVVGTEETPEEEGKRVP